METYINHSRDLINHFIVIDDNITAREYVL